VRDATFRSRSTDQLAIPAVQMHVFALGITTATVHDLRHGAKMVFDAHIWHPSALGRQGI
jgi:hypothetical protein